MARIPTFMRKRIKAPLRPSINKESSKEAEESDEESSTTSEETSETSTYVDSSELSSRESLSSISSQESLKASSSEESSESSSSEESSESSTEDISESERESEDSEFASGESEAEMEEESSKDQTLSDQIKKIINGLEFSDEDTSKKNKKGKEVIQPKIVSFSGLLGQKGNNGSASQSSDENQFDIVSPANENEKAEERELKSIDNVSEIEAISGCTGKSEKNGHDLLETDDAEQPKQIKRPQRKRRRKAWWKKLGGVIARPIRKEAFKPLINQSPILANDIPEQELLSGCMEKGDQVAKDLKETDNAVESNQMHKALQNSKGRVMCKKKEAFVKSQYCLRKAKIVDGKKLNACEPSPKQTRKPSSKQPCKPSPKQPGKTNLKQPCEPSPMQPCKPSSKQPFKPSPKQPCKPNPKQMCKPSSKQPCKPNLKQIRKPSSKQPKYANRKKKTKKPSEITPETTDNVVYGKDKYSDSEATESAEESKLFMVDSDSDISFRKVVAGILASRVMYDHCYYGNCFREDIKKIDEVIDSVIEGRPTPNDHIYSRARSRTPPIVSFRLKKRGQKKYVHPPCSYGILECQKNDLSLKKMKNPVSHIGERRLRPARRAAIDAAQKITKSTHANSRSKGQNKLDLSKFVYPTVVKTEPVDSDTESAPELHSFRTEDSFPTSATAQTVSYVERNGASENYPNFSHAIPPRTIVKTEPVETEDSPTLCPTYPNQPLNQFILMPQTIPNVTSNQASENNSDPLASLYEDLVPIPVARTDQPEADGSSPDTQSSSLQTGDPVPSFVIFVDQALNPSNSIAQTMPTIGWNCASENKTEQLPSDPPISIAKIESLKTGTVAPETCSSSLNSSHIHQSQSFPLNISSVTPPLSSDSCLKMECIEEDLSETQYETLSKAHTHYNSVRDSLMEFLPGYETVMVLNTVPFPSKTS